MDRSDLELVSAVLKHGSLAAAARSLDTLPPAVTKRLAALEAQLGQKLFQRTTRRVCATAEGELMCDRAESLLNGFEALESELRERKTEPTGRIRLAATFGFGRLWVGPALARFQALYPRVDILLELTEKLPDLALEGFDGAIWLWSIQGREAAQSMSRRLAKNQRVLVASRSYIDRHGTPLDPNALDQHQCLLALENRSITNPGADIWILRKDRAKNLIRAKVRGALSSNSGELVRDWCLLGQGIMLRSLWDVAPLLDSGRLVRVLPEWSMPDADIHWVAPYRQDSPRRIRLLIDFLLQEFADEPWKKIALRTT